MSLSQAPSRVAFAATEARRQAIADAFVARLSGFVLAAATLYILVGDTPFARGGIDHSTEISPINRYVWLTLLALSLPILWLRRRAVLALLRAGWPLLMLFGWFALSTSWALDPAASVRRVLLYFVMLAIFIAVTAGLRGRPAHQVVAIVSGLVIATDLASWPIVPHIAMTELGFAGMHAQKNVTGEIALFANLALATCLLARPPAGLRPMLWALLAASVVVLAASRSETSLSLGIAAVILLPAVRFVSRGPRTRRTVAAAGGLLVVAAALLLYLVWAGLTGRDPVAPLGGITFTERTDLWAFLLDNIRQRPLLGTGFGSLWAINPAVQPSLFTGAWFAQGTEIANQGHNAYLDLAATTGLIGLSLTLVIFARAIVLAWRETALGGSIFPLGFLLVLLVHGVTESSLFTANSVFGSLFLLIAVRLEAKAG